MHLQRSLPERLGMAHSKRVTRPCSKIQRLFSLALHDICFLSEILDLWQEELREAIAAGADVVGKDDLGNTALHKAAANGNCEIISELLKGGAKVSFC